MKTSSPAWTLRGRKSEKSVNSVPGPGAYNPTSLHLESSPNYAIGKSLRIIKSDMNNPGPGSYEPKNAGKLNPRAT